MEQKTAQKDTLLSLIAWLDANRRRLIIWGGSATIVVLVGVLVVLQQKEKEARASRALSEIKIPASITDATPAATADAYHQLAAEYAGTKAAGRALLLNATAQYQNGQYPDAQQHFDEFIQNYPESPWVPQAIYGVAASLDAQQLKTEAIAKYEDLRRRFPTSPLVDFARLALARLYEDQNRMEDALQIYEELAQTRLGSSLGMQAGMKKEDLLQRYPELARTNAAAPIMSLPNATVPTPGAPNQLQIASPPPTAPTAATPEATPAPAQPAGAPADATPAAPAEPNPKPQP